MPEPPAFLGFFCFVLQKRFRFRCAAAPQNGEKTPFPAGSAPKSALPYICTTYLKKTGLLIVASVEISKIEKFILKYSLLYAIIHDR